MAVIPPESAATAGEPLLSLEGVGFHYSSVSVAPGESGPAAASPIGGVTRRVGRKRVQVVALDGINLELRQGDRVGIVGHNGAGKSTLLRVMAGIFPPTEGRVRCRGSVSAIFGQMHGMDPNLSGYDNIRVRGMFLNLTRDQVEAGIEEIAAFSELGPYLSMPLRTYSTGMRMRLGFAVTTCFKPDCLLLDEWISTGDAAFKDRAVERTREFFEAARALVVVSHNLVFIERVCDRVLTLRQGRLVEERKIERPGA